MKILFVTPYLPDPTRPRSFNLLRGLATRGHQVSLFSIITAQQDRSHLSLLHDACEEVRLFHLPEWKRSWNGIRAFAAGLPFEAVANWHPTLAQQLREALLTPEDQPGYDLIHIEHLRAARFGLLEPGNVTHPTPVVWDAVDSASLFLNQVHQRSDRWQDRFASRLERMRVELYESWLLEQFNQVLVTSRQDRDWMLAHQVPGKKPARIDVLPNGVDLEYFHPQPFEAAEPNTIVLSGNMSLPANVAMAEHLVEEIMPLVWGRLSHVRVLIVGQNPLRRVRDLAKDARVTVTGTVEDIRPYLRRGVIAVAPLLFNLGIQNKILEAMASNRPVIASPQAISGLHVKPAEDVLVAEDSIQFAEMLIELLQQPDRQRQLAISGRAYVSQHHRWKTIVEQLEQIYSNLVNPALDDEAS
jgi:glycosyltransferase involved in cell wall biosynthesis